MFGKKDIFSIIKKGTVDDLRAFLDKNPDHLNIRDDSLCTPLIIATIENKIGMLELLIERKANLDAVNKHGCTALILAADQGKYDCVKALLEAGADATIKHTSGRTAEDCTNLTNIKQLFERYKNKSEPAEATASIQTKFTSGEFVKDGDYLVSITEKTQQTKLSLTTIYNFKAQTVTYLQGNTEAAPTVQPFLKVASYQELVKAAKYLEDNDGDLCGWKMPIV